MTLFINTNAKETIIHQYTSITTIRPTSLYYDSYLPVLSKTCLLFSCINVPIMLA